MPGTYQYDVEIKSNVAKLLSDMKQVQDRLDTVEGKEYKIKLNVDEKTLSSVISNLEKMLGSLGKGTGDFKQFENLSKELSSIVSEVQSLSKAFGKVDDSGAKTLLSSIQNIDKSLSFEKIESLFTSIESSLSSIKGVLVDVGDGEELSPLLKQLDNIREATSNIKLSLNLDLGNDVSERLNQKVSQSTQRQLEAYRKLFSAMKGTGKTNKEMLKFFEPDEASATELIGAYQGIIKRAEEKFKVGNSNIYKKLLGSTYDDLKKEIKNANAQLGRAENKRSENGILGDLFGNSKDLSGVIEQLNIIVSKLDEISVSAKGFTETFKNGLNVNASVEEIEKLTNRVKELENELAKIKVPTSSVPQESNVSSGRKDTLPNADTKLDETVTSAKELDKTLEQVDIPTDSFDKVLEKLDRTKSELVDIVKITKQSVSDAEGKFHDSYTLKDSRGSTEIYGVNSKTDKGQILRQNIVGYDKKKDVLDVSKAQVEVDKQLAKEEDNLAKAQQKKAQAFLKEQANYEEDQKKVELIKKQTLAYEELTDTISKYSEVAKRVAGGNAEDGDLELMTKLEDKISQLQKQPILSDSQVSKSEKSLVSLYDQLDKIERKLVETNQKSQDKQIAGFDKRLESYTKKTSGYNATIDRFNDGGWTSDTYLKNVQAVRDAVHQYETLLNELKGKDASLVTDEDITKLNNYEKTIKEAITAVQNMSAAQKGYTKISGQKEIQKINQILKDNSAMSKKAKDEIRAWKKEIESGNPSASLDVIHARILEIVNAEEAAGRSGKRMLDVIGEKAWYGVASAIGTYFGFNDFIRYGGQAVSSVIELDDALVDLKKTTTMSSSELNDFYYASNNVAKQMGVTTQEIIDQASSWSRLGFNTKEAATEMAQLSSQFASISPGMDVQTSQEGLVSIMKAWGLNYDQVKTEIMDPINALGNQLALSNEDIVEGMERSAAALAAVGTDYKDAFAMFSGIQEVLQNAEKSGTALRSVALRIRSFDESTEEYSDDLSNITGELADLTKTAEHSQGISIFKDGSTTEFKDLTDYFKEIADIWDEMSQKQQNDFLLKAFGRTQAQAGAALIQNYKGVAKALDVINESAGSADKEMDIVQQSLSYKLNALKETWVGTSQAIVDRGDLGKVIDALTSISEIIGGIVGNLGLLKTAALGVSAVLSFKNIGRCYVSA